MEQDAGLLEKFVRLHESHFGSDKLIKTVGFMCGFAACWHRGAGRDELAEGLEQIAAKASSVRCALRFHGGYCGVLVELENLKNLTFLGGWRDPWVRRLLVFQSCALLQYYVCENLSFLGGVAPKLIGRRLERLGGCGGLSMRSCHAWVAWGLAELASTMLKLRELNALAEDLERRPPRGDALAEARALIARARRALHMNAVRTAIFFVTGCQWCLKPGSRLAVLPDSAMQGLCLVECLVGYHSFWAGYSCSRPQLPSALSEPTAKVAGGAHEGERVKCE